MMNGELIRKNDEHWRDNLVGLSFNKTLEAAIMKQHNLENQLERLELQKERLTQKIAGRRVTLLPNIYEGAFCTVTDEKKKILDVGFNTPEDLILDNFGKWLAGFITAPTQTAVTANLTDITNTSRTIYTYRIVNTSFPITVTFNSQNSGSVGTQLQVGSGNTAAARGNYQIQTAFGTAPESGRFGTSPANYGGGSLSFSGAISAGGSGTVNETGFFGYWWFQDNPGTFYTYMLFHDILGAGVAFVAGNTINLSYAITM